MIHGFRPNWNCNGAKQHGFSKDDAEFDVIRHVIFDAFVIGFWIFFALKTPDCIAKINDPADEQHQHQPMDIDNQRVNLLAVFRGEFGHSEKFCRPFNHTSVMFFGASAFLPDDSSLLIMRMRPNAKQPSTGTRTPSNVKMPRFMPSANDE